MNPSNSHLLPKLLRSGISDWFGSREDYTESLVDFFARAQNSLHAVAITMKLSRGVDLVGCVKRKLNRSEDFIVRFSFFDPDSPALFSLSSSPSKVNIMRRRIIESISAFQELGSELALPRHRYDLRKHSVLPFGSAFLIDAYSPNGCLHVETRHHGHDYKASFGLRIQPGTPFFERSRESWMKIIDGGLEL